MKVLNSTQNIQSGQNGAGKNSIQTMVKVLKNDQNVGGTTFWKGSRFQKNLNLMCCEFDNIYILNIFSCTRVICPFPL